MEKELYDWSVRIYKTEKGNLGKMKLEQIDQICAFVCQGNFEKLKSIIIKSMQTNNSSDLILPYIKIKIKRRREEKSETCWTNHGGLSCVCVCYRENYNTIKMLEAKIRKSGQSGCNFQSAVQSHI